jgi:hypothetical protein
MDKTASGPHDDPFHPAGTFSLSAHARQLEDAMNASKTPVKQPADLQPKSSAAVKGGGVQVNDNITFVRGAKPTARQGDLPARKDVRGGIAQR